MATKERKPAPFYKESETILKSTLIMITRRLIAGRIVIKPSYFSREEWNEYKNITSQLDEILTKLESIAL